MCETEQSSECRQQKNAYEKTLRASHTSLSDNNESSKKEEKKSPLTLVPFQQMVDSISQLMSCGLALLNFAQSISQSYRCKCVIQLAQLYVLTWKMCISFPAKINHKAHAAHLYPECAAQPCSVKCIYDPLTLCSLFSLNGSQRSTSTNTRYNAGTPGRKTRLWCWHSRGSSRSLTCLCWAKLCQHFLKTTQVLLC